MASLNDFFMATPAELAGVSLEDGPQPEPPSDDDSAEAGAGAGASAPERPKARSKKRSSFPVVQAGYLDPMALAQLDQVLTGVSDDDLFEDGGTGLAVVFSEDDDEAPSIYRARREVRDALMRMTPDSIDETGELWAVAMAGTGGRRPPVSAARELLAELVELCRQADGTERDLYMWYSL